METEDQGRGTGLDLEITSMSNSKVMNKLPA